MNPTTSALKNLIAVFRHISPYLRPQRWFVVGGMIAMFAEVVLRLVEPWPLKYVIDSIIPTAVPGSSTAMRLLVIAAIAVVGAAALRALSAYCMTVCFALAGTRAMAQVRADVYAHIQRLSLRFHGTQKSGDIMTRIIADVGRLQDVSVTAAMPLLGNVIALVAMFTVMVILDWQLALLVSVAFPIFLLMSVLSSTKITRAARKQRKQEGALAGATSETLGALQVVQSYGLEGVMQRSFAVDNNKAMRDGVRASRLSAGLERKTDLLVGIAAGIVLGFGGWQVLNGRMTIGELTVFLTYLKSAFKPMRDLAKYTGRLAKAAASGERVLDLLHTPPDIVDLPHARPAARFVGTVVLDDVTVEYDGVPALAGVSLGIPAGAKVGLVGASGSGKTTVTRLLMRLIDPQSGRVLIDGTDLRDMTIESVRSQISVVLQESVLFATSIRENIRYGRPDATDGEIAWVGRAANVDEFVSQLPDGYDTVIGERGATLSGGQRQRIAIARAMLRDARIVILDEALTGLDSRTSASVLGALDELTRGRTTIVITHTIEDVLDCDYVVCLKRGRVQEVGQPRILLTDPASVLSQMRTGVTEHADSPVY